MKWLVTLAFAVGLLVIGAALAKRSPGRAEAPPAAATMAATCPDEASSPPLPLSDAWAAPLLVVTEVNATLELDGARPRDTLRPGRHVVTARGPGATPARLELEVEPFAPVLLEARRAEGAMTVLVLGARCASCAVDAAPLELGYRADARGSRAEVSRALSAGEVRRAAEAFSALPPEERTTPEPLRLEATLLALAGDDDAARARLERLPRGDALRPALVAHAQQRRDVPARQHATAIARWNALTERYQRLTDGFADAAPGVVSTLSSRFDALSVRFHRAQVSPDAALEVETTLDEAVATLAQFVSTLRRERPGDCAWQAKVNGTL